MTAQAHILENADVLRAARFASKRLAYRFPSQSADDYYQNCMEWVALNVEETQKRLHAPRLLTEHLFRRLYRQAQRFDTGPGGQRMYSLQDRDLEQHGHQHHEFDISPEDLYVGAADYTLLEPGDTYTREHVVMLAACLQGEAETRFGGIRITEGMPRSKSNPAHSNGNWAERVDFMNAWNQASLSQLERRTFFLHRTLGWTVKETADALGLSVKAARGGIERAEKKLHAKINGR